MLTFKSGVKMDLLQPQMVLGLLVIHTVFERFKYVCVITSLNDGHHRPDSLHYSGLAVDLRIRHIPQASLSDLVASLCAALGDNFDVVLEKTHIHVEYDLKF